MVATGVRLDEALEKKLDICRTNVEPFSEMVIVREFLADSL
jgi:hypothetical protein